MDCKAAFKAWYFEHGADWNASHVWPVWEAAWRAATFQNEPPDNATMRLSAAQNDAVVDSDK